MLMVLTWIQAPPRPAGRTLLALVNAIYETAIAVVAGEPGTPHLARPRAGQHR
jgi:hypothetical protein